MSVAAVTAWLEARLVDGVTTEVRIAASIGIALATVLIATIILPRLTSRGRRLMGRWARNRFGETVSNATERVEAVVPVGLVLTVGIRLLQALLLASGGFVVLVIWGQIGAAWQLVSLGLLAAPTLGQLLSTGVVLVIAVVLNDVIRDLVKEYTSDTNRVTAHQEQILTRVIQVALILAAITAVFSIWGVDIGSLLVGAGFLGIVIGLAARQTLGSLLAGFVLMFSRPFEIGDWVEIGGEEGIVTKITIMNTIMRNFDGEHIIIPNDNVNNRPITNRTRDGQLRIHLEVGIDYDDDPEHAKEVAREAVKEVKMVENNPQPQVFPVAFGDSAVTLDIRFWIAPPTPQRRWRATAGVVETVKARFATESISIPFPQRTLGNRDGDGGTVSEGVRSVDHADAADASDG